MRTVCILCDSGSAMSAAQPSVHRNYIAGAWASGVAGATMPILAPASEKLIATVVHSDAEDVGAAVRAADGARAAWRSTTPQERAAALFALADQIDAHSDELATLESLN